MDYGSFGNSFFSLVVHVIVELALIGMYLLVSRVIAVFGALLYAINKIDGGESLQRYVTLSAMYGVEGWMLVWSIKHIIHHKKYCYACNGAGVVVCEVCKGKRFLE